MDSSLLYGILQHLPAILTAAGAALGALAVIWKKGIKPLIKMVKNYQELLRKVDFIVSELKPNGGSSFKDIVTTIQRDIALASERQRALLADVDYAAFETDELGNCTWVNRTYMRLVQRSLSELLDHGWINAIAPEDRDAVVSGWYNSVTENREFSMDLHFQTPLGEKIPVRCVSYKMTDSHNKLLGYYGIVKRTEI